LAETRFLVHKLRKVKPTQTKYAALYAWDYDQWLNILEQDMFEEDKKKTVMASDEDFIVEELSISYEDEFHSVEDLNNVTAAEMLDLNVSNL
jgi:hypothetical protein